MEHRSATHRVLGAAWWIAWALTGCLACTGCTEKLGVDELPPVPELDAVQARLSERDYESAAREASSLLDGVVDRFGRDSIQAARVLDVLAVARLGLDDPGGPAPLELAERSLRIKRRRLVHDHPDLVPTHRALGRILRQDGDYARSVQHFEEALRIFEVAQPSPGLSVLPHLQDLANAYIDVSRYEDASRLYAREQSILVAQSSQPLDLARSLYSRGRLMVQMGDYDDAAPMYRDALGIVREELGPHHALNATILNSWAILHDERGDYPQSLELYDEALSIARESLGETHPLVAACWTNIGFARRELGDFDGAREAYEESLRLKRARDPDHPGVASTLIGLAELEHRVGNVEEAVRWHQAALELRRRAHGEEHADVGTSYEAFARLMEDTGDFERAERYFARALAIWEATLPPEHEDLSEALRGLAGIKARLGDAAEAERLYARAMELRERGLGPAHPRVAELLTDYARFRAAVGPGDEALNMAIRAAEISRDHTRQTAAALSDRDALRYAALRETALDLILSIALDEPSAERVSRALDTIVRSRALVLEEMALRSFSLTDDAVNTTIVNRFVHATRRVANLVVRGPGNDPRGYREQLKRARKERDAAERLLVESSPAYAQRAGHTDVGLADARRHLPADGRLVSFVRFNRLRLEDGNAGAGSSIPSYVALLLRPDDSPPTLVPLGDAASIDALIAGWRASVERSAELTEKELAVGLELRARVWDPIQQSAAGGETYFVVPDGALSLLSFAALPADGESYLVERDLRLLYLAAERDLVPSTRHRRGEGILLVGGVDYGERRAAPTDGGPCIGWSELTVEALPATEAEVTELATLWQRFNGGVTLLSGRDANEAHVKQEAPGKRFVHLATHGFFLERDCTTASSAVRGFGRVSEGNGPRPAGSDDAFGLSGLALARFNDRASAPLTAEDGVLSAQEIVAMDLSSVEWAVLSACDTGLGRIQTGEGVLGMRRALRIAGVETSIMSLWSVDDEATRRWMNHLYESRLALGMSTADSVRRASIALIAERRRAGLSTQPFYWGAWIASGSRR